MDAVKCNFDKLDIDDEIVKTEELIQRLTDAEESTRERRRFIQAQRRAIDEEICRNRDEQLLLRVGNLLIHIISIEQFPYQMEWEPIYDFTRRTRIRERPPSPTPKDLANPIRKLSSEFRHKSKNLAMERKMAKEIQQCELSRHQIHLSNKEIDADANYFYTHWSRFNWEPLPSNDVKTFITIWAGKVEHLSGLIFRDSKNSTAPAATAEKLMELFSLGREFYLQTNISRAEFKQHWDSLNDVKSSIERIKFDLSKERLRLKRRWAKVNRLQEKYNKMHWMVSELESKAYIIGKQKSAAHIYMLELEKIKDMSQVRKKKPRSNEVKRRSAKSRNRFKPNPHLAGFELGKFRPSQEETRWSVKLPYCWL